MKLYLYSPSGENLVVMFLLRTLLFFIILIPQLILAQTESAFVFPDNAEMISGGSADISVDLFLPEDRHLYVENLSAMSFNKPTQFNAKTKGFLVSIKENPDTDKKEEDLILKGKGSKKAGTYILTVFETSGRKPSPKPEQVSIEVTTQWCNSVSGKCFEPKKLNKTISIIITKEKEKSPVVNARSSGGISWTETLEKAKASAQKSKQNIFFAISAPEWCGACAYMEKNLFTKKNVIQTLNSKFVSVQLNDESPEIKKFNFEGYPTLFILDPKGKILIQDFNFSDEPAFLSALKKYEASANSVSVPSVENPDPKVHSYSIKQELKFTENANGKWALDSQEGKYTLDETRRDEKFIILLNGKTSTFYALPVASKTAFYMKDGKWIPLD
jgi:thioredoxin-related protein